MGDNNLPIREVRIAAVRQFNRYYTRQIGALERTLLQSPFTLIEARVLFELANRDRPTAKQIGEELGLDAGYLSRIVQAFVENGLVARTPLPSDRRQLRLSLTKKGRAAFARLDKNSRHNIGTMLEKLTDENERHLVDAMTNIERLLGHDDAVKKASSTHAILRMHRPGDMGWVVQQHGALYAREFGWDISFEGMVADIVAQFLKNFDPAHERCWIAEIDGRQVGSVFLVKHSEGVAKLRLLIVDPAGRGMGLGKQLVDECIAFARAHGYRRMTLWTQSMLLAARGIYVDAGFKLIASEPHRSFGHDLIGETWELEL